MSHTEALDGTAAGRAGRTSRTARTILIAEDEQVLRESLAELLATEGYRVLQAPDGKAAHELVLAQPVDLVVSDIRMPEMDGMVLLQHLKELAPETPVIMLTAYGTVQDAVECIRMGACDYLLKPVEFDDLLLKIRRAMNHRAMIRACRVMTGQLSADSSFHDLVGRSAPMVALFEMVRKLSTVKSNVLLIGESGTGKELFARAIHYNGITRDSPFVPVNCGAIPSNLVESELFGYCRGAFTGADEDRAGVFEAADGGTLFLDEISSLPSPVQASLLRAIEEKVILPVGGTCPRKVDVRVISASNQNLDEMVAAGQFREDLLFRLRVVELKLPALRDRTEDIPLLAGHFLRKHARAMNKGVTEISNDAMRAMLERSWRGNVRELANAIERAVLFADGRQITLEHLPFANAASPQPAPDGDCLKGALRQFERRHILASLSQHDYDKATAAQQLGIGVSSLYRKLEDLDIPKNNPSQGSDDRTDR